MIGARRTLASASIALLLVAVAIASMWLMASSGVFTGAEQALPGAPASGASASAAESLSVNSAFQVAQPRDPFKPLIDDGGAGGTTVPGDTSGTTVPGGTTTTVPGGTTTTTVSDDPAGIRVALLEVREEGGSRVAVVEVDGTTYTVGVGDTFATDFKVVSLTDNAGVFTHGESAFTLAVGQSILK